MSQLSHDVPAVDHRCTSYRPGHQVHFIHARTTWEDEGAVDVLALVRPDGLIRLESAGDVVVCWHHDIRRLSAALRRTGGFARWRPRRHALAVPTAPGHDRLFNLADPDDAADCAAVPSTTR